MITVPQNFNYIGPLTYETHDGRIVQYGVVSGAGSGNGSDGCQSVGIYGRVAEPGILEWIIEWTKKRSKKYLFATMQNRYDHS